MKKVLEIISNIFMYLSIGISKIFKTIGKINIIAIIKNIKSGIANMFKRIKNSRFSSKQKLASLFVCIVILVTFSNDFIALSQNLVERPCKVILVDGVEVVKVALNTDEDTINQEIYNLIRETEGRSINVLSKIQIVDGIGYGYEVSDINEITHEIIDEVDYEVLGVNLTLNDEYTFYVDSFDVLNEVLDEFKAPYSDEKFYLVDFKEDITLEPAFHKKEDLLDANELKQELSVNKSDKIEHTIVSGDTLWDLSIHNEVTVEDLLYVNTDITEESLLQIGQTIIIANEVPMLSVRTYERVNYEAPAQFETEYINNDAEFVTYRKVITEGALGVKDVTADIVSDNGVQTDTIIINEVVLVEPISEVVEVGTMNTPPKKSIGTFIFPTTGRISDRFATRGGRHQGIDIANASGTSVNASDGGRVSYSGWQGGYGNLVIIDHGNGYSTYYAHNSKLLVSVGQMVAQGEELAKMGTTGNSTGNHCHFEIRLNGVPQNPFNYVTY